MIFAENCMKMKEIWPKGVHILIVPHRFPQCSNYGILYDIIILGNLNRSNVKQWGYANKTRLKIPVKFSFANQ